MSSFLSANMTFFSPSTSHSAFVCFCDFLPACRHFFFPTVCHPVFLSLSQSVCQLVIYHLNLSICQKMSSFLYSYLLYLLIYRVFCVQTVFISPSFFVFHPLVFLFVPFCLPFCHFFFSVCQTSLLCLCLSASLTFLCTYVSVWQPASLCFFWSGSLSLFLYLTTNQNTYIRSAQSCANIRLRVHLTPTHSQ
jgi:hypothetical protein